MSKADENINYAKKAWSELNKFFYVAELTSFEYEMKRADSDFLEVEVRRLAKLIETKTIFLDVHDYQKKFSEKYGTIVNKFIKIMEENKIKERSIPHRINLQQDMYTRKKNNDDKIKIEEMYLDLFTGVYNTYQKNENFMNNVNDFWECLNKFIKRESCYESYNPQNKEANTFYNYLNIIFEREVSHLTGFKKHLNNDSHYNELSAVQKKMLRHIYKAMYNLGFPQNLNLNSLNNDELNLIADELKTNKAFKSGDYKKLNGIILLNKWHEIQSILNMQSLNMQINDDYETQLLDTIADDQEFPEFENDNPDMLKTVISKLGNVKAKEKDKEIFCASLFFDYIDGEIKSLQKDDKNEIIRTPAEAFDVIEPEINQLSELFKDNENEYQAITKTIDYFKEKIRNGEAIKKGDFAKSLGIKHQSDINRAFNNIKNLLCKEE